MTRGTVNHAIGAGEVTPGSGAMFDRIARRYDLLNRLLSLGLDRRWRRREVAALGLGQGGSVLDLATGTGDVALEVVRQCRDARVIGLDPALGMLSRARRKKVEPRGVLLLAASAEALPLRDGAVDAVTMAFGIRNVPDRPKALREMARVLREGGKAAILELGEPRGSPFAWLARVWVRRVVPWLGALLSGAAEYRYLQRSMEAFPAPAEFAGIMGQSGFRRVDVTPMMLGTVHLFAGATARQGAAVSPGQTVRGHLEELRSVLARRPTDRLWLVSMTAPLAPLERLWEAIPSGEAVLWDPPGGPGLAGLGAAVTVTGSGPRRFATVAELVEAALAGVCRHASAGAPEPEPRLLGGGSFVPGSTDTPPWAGFPDLRFALPRWTYAVAGASATIVLAVPPGDADTAALVDEARRVFDALERKGDCEAPEVLSSQIDEEARAAWISRVLAAQREMAAGRLAKVVLVTHARVAISGPDSGSVQAALLRRLGEEGQGLFRFGLRLGGKAFLGASPELLVARRGEAVRAEALAGTLPRQPGDDTARLEARMQALLQDPKQREEHALVVAALRGSLGEVCSPLESPERPHVRVLRRLLHLSTPFEGRLARPVSVLELAQRLHPTPAVGGEPREAALGFIATHEAVSRGWFAGPFGVLGAGGDGELAVALRSVLLDGSTAHIWAGAGILPASQPEVELEETRVKARACLDALGVAT